MSKNSYTFNVKELVTKEVIVKADNYSDAKRLLKEGEYILVEEFSVETVNHYLLDSEGDISEE